MSDSPDSIPSESRPLSRRALLYRAGGAGVVLASSPLIAKLERLGASTAEAATSASNTLNILTWEGYHDPKWLAEFNRKTGITVNATNVGAPA